MHASDAAGAQPALYLDLDDTLLSYATGRPQAGLGARRFLHWAIATFEVRWLTRWCPDGRMPDGLLADLARMTGVPRECLRTVRGFDWRWSASKLDGIAWLEHRVLGRPFLWIEDEYGVGEFERHFLARHGFAHVYRHCNVTTRPADLVRLHARLRGEWPGESTRREPGAFG